MKRKRKYSKARRRRARVSGPNKGFGGAMSFVQNAVLPAAVGYVAGEVLDRQLTALAKNATVANAAKLAIGVALDAMAPGFFGAMGVGMAANGAANLALPALQNAGIAGGINLLPPGEPSYRIAGGPVGTDAQPLVRVA